MKRWISTLAVLCSFNLFAASSHLKCRDTDGSYAGHGRWVDNAGNHGKYTATMVKTSAADDSAQMSGSIVVDGDQTISWSATVRKDSRHRYSIYGDQDQKIGQGYCFHGLTIKCHHHIELEGVSMEETTVFTKHRVFHVGSKVYPDGKVIMFEDHLRKARTLSTQTDAEQDVDQDLDQAEL